MLSYALQIILPKRSCHLFSCKIDSKDHKVIVSCPSLEFRNHVYKMFEDAWKIRSDKQGGNCHIIFGKGSI